MSTKVYQALAGTVRTHKNRANGSENDKRIYAMWEQRAYNICRRWSIGPSGGLGMVGRVVFLVGESKPNRLVFEFRYANQNENGDVTHFTDHKMIITPDFEMGFDMRCTGRNVNESKESFYEMFSYWLGEEAPNLVITPMPV